MVQRVLVFGATGAQGGSVAEHLLKDPAHYKVIAVTRNPEKQNALNLKNLGAEVVKADLSDVSSYSGLLANVDAVFLVQNFWEHFSEQKEEQEGKAFVDEVKKANPKIKLIYSALEDVSKETNGKINKVHHFNGKGRVAEYIRANLPEWALVQLAFYHDNFFTFFKPSKAADGSLSITMPMGDHPLNLVDVRDTGLGVKALLDHWATHKNKAFNLVSDLIPVAKITEILGNVVGKKITYNPVPVSVFASFGFPGAEDLAEMFQFYVEGPIDRNPAPFLQLAPSARHFEKWAHDNKDALIKAFEA
eukprot:comp17408_c0_seq1/m.29371 comp17408_c0_seq1/g.29371  ORF comp17408_c0_seq1/g.29371 comp17408_c0_seq1/m.29371 type:complete len:304 (-) comp17408_c0_seq1:19-930(-)